MLSPTPIYCSTWVFVFNFNVFLFWAYLNQYFKNSLLRDKILEYLHVFNKVKVMCNVETDLQRALLFCDILSVSQKLQTL